VDLVVSQSHHAHVIFSTVLLHTWNSCCCATIAYEIL